MKKTYKHLTETERNLIVVMVNRDKSIHEIARELMRDPGTISREIKRNHGRKWYRAHLAQKRAIEKHHNAHKHKRLKTYALQLEVESMLKNGWSPELIAGRIKKEAILPTISHEAIYQWINPMLLTLLAISFVLISQDGLRVNLNIQDGFLFPIEYLSPNAPLISMNANNQVTGKQIC